MNGTVFINELQNEMRHKMKRFSIIFKQYLQYYLYGIIVLFIVFIFTRSPVVLGLILGLTGSICITYTFEYYLAKAKDKDNIHISTGNVWRYLTVIIACCIWVLYKEYINIFGVIVGLSVSYVLIILKPLIQKN
jgi:ATP synthase protein I